MPVLIASRNLNKWCLGLSTRSPHPAGGQGAPPHVQPDPGTAGAAATAVLAGSAGVAGSKAVGAGAGAEGQAATPTAMAQQEWQASGREVSEEALLPLVLRMDQVSVFVCVCV